MAVLLRSCRWAISQDLSSTSSTSDGSHLPGDFLLRFMLAMLSLAGTTPGIIPQRFRSYTDYCCCALGYSTVLCSRKADHHRGAKALAASRCMRLNDALHIRQSEPLRWIAAQCDGDPVMLEQTCCVADGVDLVRLQLRSPPTRMSRRRNSSQARVAQRRAAPKTMAIWSHFRPAMASPPWT